jgi:hypothetical protein
MLVFLSFFFITLAQASCAFKADVRSVYSLSAPVTLALRDLDLLKSGIVKGVSVFHPLKQEDFSGAILPGGIYLSTKVSQDFEKSVVIFDESRELRKNLSGKLVEIKTRDLEPLDVSEEIIAKLKPLLQHCENELRKWKEETLLLQSKLLGLVKNKPSIVFYLGEFIRGRPPEMIISHDGVVKLLKLKGKINSYPSTLAYTPWSARIISSMPVRTLSLYIKDSGREQTTSITQVSELGWNVKYPGALTPGKTQIEAWIYLFEHLAVLK